MNQFFKKLKKIVVFLAASFLFLGIQDVLPSIFRGAQPVFLISLLLPYLFFVKDFFISFVFFLISAFLLEVTSFEPVGLNFIFLSLAFGVFSYACFVFRKKGFLFYLSVSLTFLVVFEGGKMLFRVFENNLNEVVFYNAGVEAALTLVVSCLLFFIYEYLFER